MRENENNFSIEKMALVLGVSARGFYAYRNRKTSSREETNKNLLEEIKKIYEEGRKLYGSPRVHGRLIKLGIRCSRKRVARLMRKSGLAAQMRKKWKRTTIPGKREVAKNLVNQDFTVDFPNSTWVSDITYVATKEGWLYVAVILDLFSRKVIGLSMGERIDTRLIENALRQAILHRSPSKGLIHHSDRGSQYTSQSFQAIATRYGISLSMSSKGNCYDNAVAESFFHTLKTEHICLNKFQTREEAKRSIFEYVEVFYNRKRVHSFLGYVSPEEFEQKHRKEAV